MLDASAAVELLLNTPEGALVRDRIADADESLHAPHLLSVEVAQVLRRYVTTGSIDAELAEAALDDLAALDVARYPHEPFLPRAWELRGNLTVYDAVYVALAEVLGAPLLTFDARIGAAPGHDASVDVLRG